jgi:hypothetical protein
MVAIVRPTVPYVLEGDTPYCIIGKQASVSFFVYSRNSLTCPRSALTDRCRDLYQSPTHQSSQAIFNIAHLKRPLPRGGHGRQPYIRSSSSWASLSSALMGVCSRNSERHPHDLIRTLDVVVVLRDPASKNRHRILS